MRSFVILAALLSSLPAPGQSSVERSEQIISIQQTQIKKLQDQVDEIKSLLRSTTFEEVDLGDKTIKDDPVSEDGKATVIWRKQLTFNHDGVILSTLSGFIGQLTGHEGKKRRYCDYGIVSEKDGDPASSINASRDLHHNSAALPYQDYRTYGNSRYFKVTAGTPITLRVIARADLNGSECRAHLWLRYHFIPKLK